MKLEPTTEKQRRMGKRHWLIGGSVIAGLLLCIGVYAVSTYPLSQHMGAINGGTSAAAATGSSTTSSYSTATTTSVAQSAAVNHTATAKSAAPDKRDIIESAHVTLTVKDVSQARNQLQSMVSRSGGFVADMTQSGKLGANSVQLTARIPEAKFSSFLHGSKQLGTVQQFSQTGTDVTDEHNQLTGQISELENEAKAYTRLYDRAQSMKDMLQIQQALTQATQQISNLNDQLHGLNQSIAYATVQLTINATPQATKTSQGTLTHAVVASLHFMADFAHWLLICLVWVLPWAIILGLIWLCVHLLRRRIRK